MITASASVGIRYSIVVVDWVSYKRILFPEHSDMISKWQNMLEKHMPDHSGTVQSESLGQFLRLLHYYLITLVSGEKDFQLL